MNLYAMTSREFPSYVCKNQKKLKKKTTGHFYAIGF